MSADQQIENLARAFYCVQNSGGSWEQASESLRNYFRKLARDAVAMDQELSTKLLASFPY